MKSYNQLQEGVPNPGLEGGPAEGGPILEILREELERQLQERNQELASTLSLLKATLESTKDGIMALDTSGRVLSINSKFAAIWGFPDEVLERRDHAEMVAYAAQHLKNPEKFLARTQASRVAPETEVFDIIEFKDGRVFERRATPQWIDNRCVGAVVNWHSVPKRKRAEQEMREAQALYHSLVDQMPSGVFRKDAQGRYVFVNTAYCKITGLPADQILGKTASELVECMKADMGRECPVTDQLGSRGESHHELIMRTGREIQVEDEYADPSGKSRYYHVFKSPVFGSGGAIIGSQGILLDVTERKRAEAELAREHDLLRMLLDYCPAPIYFKDLQSRLVKLSQSEAKNLMRVALSRHCAEHPDETGDKLPPHLTSLERFHKHVIGKSDSDIYGPERAAEFRKAEEEIIRTGQPISGNLEKTVCPDGKVIWFVTTKAPWRDNKGEIIGTFGISTDMTDIKEAEARLDSERALLGSLLDNSPDHIYFKDLQSRFIKVSRKHAEQFGFHNPDEIFGKTDFDFFDKTHAEPAFQEEQEIIRTGEPLIGKVQNKMTKDGRTSWALLSKLPLRDKAGNIIGTFGISKDITAMKEAQAKLDAERDLVRCLLDSSPDQIYFKDLQSRFLKSSKAQAEHFGVKHPDELVGRSDSDFFDEAHARPALEDEQEIIRTGVPMIGKVEKEVSKDGHVTWCITSKLPLRDNAGKIIGTFGISRDITAMKEAEAKLDAERDLVRCLLEASHDHIYFKDLESRFIKTSQSKANHIGRKHPDEFVGKTDFDLFDEAHARPAFEDEQKIIRTGAPIIGKVEKEVFKDGKVSWALTTKMPLRDKTGKIIGTFGISKDITAMKEAEAKLELLHRQLLEASRQAGMAEVATGVLHNVGNVLNSVNVGASMLADRLRKSKVSSVGRVAAMMKEHEQNLGEFVTSDPKGRLLPSFLAQLADHLAAEQVTALEELAGLEKNIDHIKDIVAMQQNYAKVSGVTQTIKVVDLVDDALHMNDHALIRHDVKLVRDYDPSVQEITVDNHKVMQILINLVRNAKYACDDSGLPEKRMVVRVAKEGGRVKISVIDNGIGIAPENLTRVFNHGFTTRKEGHGFGLHSGALAAKELGGSLTVQSDGVGRGATFTLELPLQPPTPAS